MQEKNLELVDKIMTALQGVEDPELLIDVVNLGLIYGIDIEGDHATIKMTLTIVGCPLSTYLQNAIEKAVLSVPEINKCDIKLVWYPVWNPERMTVAAKKQLGILDNEQALDQENEIEETEEKEKIIDFSVPIKKLAEEYPDFIQIMYNMLDIEPMVLSEIQVGNNEFKVASGETLLSINQGILIEYPW